MTVDQPRVQTGVLFPAGGDGRRSSASTGRAAWADSIRALDPALASRIESARDWRTGYLDAVVAHTAAATATAESATGVARAGLASLQASMTFERDGAITTVGAALHAPGPELVAETVRGTGEQAKELVLPYRGEQLSGDALRRRLDEWVAAGTVEQSCATAIHAVLDEPDWLDLSDRAFCLLGAGAEMGPLQALSGWGAHIVAVDAAVPKIWDRLRRRASEGAGMVTFPTSAGVAGADLLTQTPEIAAFATAAAPGLPLVTGSYAYADGGGHVQVVVASDAIVAHLLEHRPGSGYAELATPTDTFVVGADVLAESRRRWGSRGVWGALQAPVRTVSRGSLYARGYATVTTRADGTEVGIADVLVPQQGPNYTLAKRVQRWRAAAAQADGHLVSANVAPATRTRSVTKNRLLAAAYAGAGSFHVEVFAPETSRVLMAAMLVHDVRTAVAPPAHPDDLLVSGAAHGGLWRVGYSPRSVLGLAAVLGLPRTLR